MNGTLTQTQQYLDAVRAHLADVPQPEREDLLEDLEQHLDEVAAEAEGSLEDRLGPPAEYAAELRASAGLEGRHRPRIETLLTDHARRLRAVPRHHAVSRTADSLRELRPAWWVLRGYVLLVAWRLMSNSAWYALPIPKFGGSTAAGLVAIATAVCASVWLGHRKSRVWRVVGGVLSGITILAGLFVLSHASSALSMAHYSSHGEETYCDYPPCGDYGEAFSETHLLGRDGRPITNIYAYGEDGSLLRDVRLYDQRGKPISILRETTPYGRTIVTSYPVDMDGNPVTNAFPQQQALQTGGASKRIEPPTVEVQPLRAATPATEPPVAPNDRREPSRDQRIEKRP